MSHPIGETVDSRLKLAGGTPARLVSKLLPGPALSATLTVMTPVPVYLTQNEAGRDRRMELRTMNGTSYWAEDFRAYLRTDTARGSLELRPMTRMDDEQIPAFIVFTNDGAPSAAIIAGYIAAIPGNYHAYEPTGFRLRPTNNRTAENALLTLAQTREISFGRR
jgi:hypothetical protein